MIHDLFGIDTPLDAFAIVLGSVWLLLNVYFLYPLARAAWRWFIGLGLRPVVFAAPTDRSDDELPAIDLLVPAYDEPTVIDHAIRSIREADYPVEKLHVHVLVEPDDDATRATLASVRDAFAFREVVVPEEYPGPRNKPRALNYGFAVSDAPVVGVLDAEDIVDPSLFRVVVHALFAEGRDVVQGRLDAANEDDGLLNLLYRGEYGLWHGLVLPNLWRAGFPVPLGGTTNFFHREVLASAGSARRRRQDAPWDDADEAWLTANDLPSVTPWDPLNVTEDFELGLLLWLEGFELGIADVVTREESPLGVRAWIRQRTRWEKGKLYTLRQYLREPPRTRSGWPLVYVQALTPHVGPLNVLGVVFLLAYANVVRFEPSPTVSVVLLGGAILAGAHMVLHAYGYARATDRRGATRLVRTAVNGLCLPLYWVLEWVAEIRAVWHLLTGKLHWEKTTHHARHVGGLGPEAVEVLVAERGARVTFREGPAGWTWRLAFDDDAAVSARTYPTRVAAREALAEVLAATPPTEHALAEPWGDVGSAVFHVHRADGAWTWTLRDGDGVVAAATSTFPDRTAALDAVDAVRAAAATERRVTLATPPDAPVSTSDESPAPRAHP